MARFLIAALMTVLACAGVPADPQVPSSLSEILRAAGARVDGFSHDADGVLGTEDYVQQAWA